MKSRLEEKMRAIELRKQGLSYRDIMKQVPVSKSSLSGWFKFLVLTEKEENDLEQRARENIGEGRERAALSNRRRRVKREIDVKGEAQVLFDSFKHDRIFILGIGLYWAEGSKRASSFGFMNSDPSMIKFMIMWVSKYLGVSEDNISLRLHTHEAFRLEGYEVFWSSFTKIPLDHFKKTCYKQNNQHGVFKKNPEYKGCIRIEIPGGMAVLRKMIFLKEALENELKMLYS